MNKRIAIAAFLGLTFSLTGLTSCKKCLECKFVEGNTSVPRTRNSCNEKHQSVDLFKADVIKEAKSFGIQDEEDVKCVYK